MSSLRFHFSSLVCSVYGKWKSTRDTSENSLKSRKIGSRSLVSSGKEVDDIPPSEASFNLDCLGLPPTLPSGRAEDSAQLLLFSCSEKTECTQDGIPAALFQVNGAGFIADIVGSQRWAQFSSVSLLICISNVEFILSLTLVLVIHVCG